MVAALQASWLDAVSAKSRFCVNDAVPLAAIVVFITFAGNVKSEAEQPPADVVITVETVSTWTL